MRSIFPSPNIQQSNSEEEVHTDIREPPDSSSKLSGLHILVVDDAEDTRMMLSVVLQNCGAHVTTVTSASEALVALVELRPNVLVSDIGMPGEDGYSLIQKVRALPRESGGRTRALALTAYAGKEERMRALRCGFQIHLSKPVEPVELITAVANLVGRFEED